MLCKLIKETNIGYKQAIQCIIKQTMIGYINKDKKKITQIQAVSIQFIIKQTVIGHINKDKKQIQAVSIQFIIKIDSDILQKQI